MKYNISTLVCISVPDGGKRKRCMPLKVNTTDLNKNTLTNWFNIRFYPLLSKKIIMKNPILKDIKAPQKNIRPVDTTNETLQIRAKFVVSV